jgi:magnesium-transporting ATPase (P-type)
LIFAIALCHSVIVEVKDDDLIYNASSPDELSIVNAARYFGVTFVERTDNGYIVLKRNDEVYKFKLLNLFEFNSDRKRMSVIIRDEQGTITLLCKGADTVIAKLLSDNNEFGLLHKINKYLEDFGRKGLRTLMIARKVITKDEYKQFYKTYHAAISSVLNKKELVNSCYEDMEKNLELIGATAIEDCLQDNLSKDI